MAPDSVTASLRATRAAVGDSAPKRFFMGAGLPVFVLSAVAVYELFLAAILFTPQEWGAWGAFSTEFKVWCFDYDLRTGGMEWAAVIVMLIEPFFIAAISAFLWRRSLSTLWSGRVLAGQRRALAAGTLTALAVVVGLFVYGRPNPEAQLPPFPGERIRTSLTPPEFRFSDQKGKLFGIGDAQGKVVLLTGVYAQCSTSCPQILIETRDLLDGMPPDLRERVVVAALSLNPEYDTRELMGGIVEAYGLTYPQFRYLNDDPGAMNDVLTRLGFSRSVDPETGVIDHANLFILVDAGGRIAYRLTLQPRHQPWLREAVQLLATEAERLAQTF